MVSNRYIITRSNYTIKEKHKTLKNGSSIYERDYMTTTNLGGWDSGTIPYGESNFKFVHNQNDNNTRSFNNGNWLDHDGNTIWTLNDLSNTKQKEESAIVVKPNKNSFRDFAYFGSCVELLKVSLSNIIKYFPGELYISNELYRYAGASGSTVVLGSDAFTTPVVVNNPFNIDIVTTKLTDETKQRDDYNELRYFSESYNKYEFIGVNGEDNECIGGWSVVTKDKKCYNNGDLISNITITQCDGDVIKINEYYFSSGNVLITDGSWSGYHIRPLQKYIDEIFDEKFSAFESFLLDRDTKPKYTIQIDVPTETDNGLEINRKSFTMPTENGWNLSINSGDYGIYVKNLLDVAAAYDEFFSNNLWENIVHESIKNMDITLSKPLADEDIYDYQIGVGNLHGLMLAYARQFDDIKLSIENIKFTNTVTYNENNNIPDYFLSDTLELSGWEVSSAVKTLDDNVKVGNLFAGDNKAYTTEDVNTTFMRNLKINSKEIFKRKGNRQSIEMLMALFGLSSYEFGRNYYTCLPETSKIIENGRTLSWEDLTEEQKSQFYDYKFDEYVVVATPTSSASTDYIVPTDESLCIEQINQQIKGDSVVTIVEGEYNEAVEIINTVIGLPVRLVYIDSVNPSGETETYKYLIPWFDKNTVYDGKTYFQMYGGWNKVEDADGSHYTETLKYLNIVDNIGELAGIYESKLTEGEIYYVNNIENYREYFPSFRAQPSHYFYIQNKSKSYEYGVYNESSSTWSDGWQIISEYDVNTGVKHGIQVKQLESIIDEYRGNNPHVGFGTYDAGDKYLERLAHVFDGAIDDGLFDDCIYTCDGEEKTMEEIKGLGFNLTDKLIDNVKCWYFVDNTNPNKNIELTEQTATIVDYDGNIYDIPCGYDEKPIQEIVKVGEQAMKNGDVHNTTNLNAFNFETQIVGSNDEAAANSIINIKNVTLTFTSEKYGNPEFNKYLHEVILFYLSQILPTTTVMTIKYFGNDTFETCLATPVITGVSK